MRWFRDNIRHGSWLALFALVINLGLSFGHVHAAGGERAGSGLTSLAVVTTSVDDQRHGHPGDARTDYLCPICTAVSAMATGLASAPPTLPLEFVAVSLDQPIKSQLVSAARPAAAFRSRGPPAS